MPFVFIGVGSNIEPRLEYIHNGINELQKFVKICKISNIYETEPWGNPNLLPFYNAVLKIETDFLPNELLDILLFIEKQFGRTRIQKWDNRTLDLDILDYEGKILNEKNLILPHPYIEKRNFVVIPWYEIEKDWILSNHLKINDLYFSFFPKTFLKLVYKSPII